jgi:hypothetical protein
MSESATAKVYTLPLVRLTKVSERPGPGFIPVDHQVCGRPVKYWRQPLHSSNTRWTTFAKLPLVLDVEGRPWEPACLWLLDRAQAKPLGLSALTPAAQDLAHYKRWLDELGLAWDNFSDVDKYHRPTYLYKNHVQGLLNAGEIKASTASRRMTTVIGLYRFLMSTPRMEFQPLNDPWVENRIGLQYRDSRGFKQVKEVTTTDVSIHTTSPEDAWDGTIADEGKLRPLPVEEQQALLAALKRLGNPEYSLMHYVSLLTGARVQTVLTLRVRDFMLPPDQVPQWSFKLRCGPGTGIDTKRDKPDRHLSVPRQLYEMLHVYSRSERARRRRARSRLGDDPFNYLFLTVQGQPYYESKEERYAVPDTTRPMRRSSSTGQNLREFITDAVIPEVRKTLPKFRYRFHDLRATFGMNWVDHIMGQERAENTEKGRYLWARDQLRRLMWHNDAKVTDRYLEYRQHMHQLQQAQAGWSQHLIELIQQH